MCLSIEPHGLGAKLSFHCLYDAVLVRRVFVNDVERALASRGGDQRRFGIVYVSVNTVADGERLAHDSSAVGIHDHEHLTYTDRKSTRLNSSHVKISYAVF